MSTGVPSVTAEGAGDSDALYLHLRSLLVSHEIAPGSVLTETSVASRFGVSRTPAREILARLEHDRLIERASRGFRVRVSTAEDVMELYEARIALESRAAASAALRRTDLDLARLSHLSAELPKAQSPEAVSAITAAWHEALWIAAHNSALEDLLSRVIHQMRLFDDSSVGAPPNVETTIAEHDRILEAIRSNDASGAQVALADHLGRTRDLRLAVLAQAMPDPRR